jgi:5-methylthioadenosine/S-adenosylhomocysteine deaminase
LEEVRVVDGTVVLVPELMAAGTAFLPGQAVAIRDGLVTETGPVASVLASHPDAKRQDLPRRLLLPGGINGHNHSFQVLMRGLGEDADFFQWRSQVLYPMSEALTREDIRRAAELAFADMLRHGITTVADFFYLNDQGSENALTVAEAARAVGIRLVLARTFYDWEGAPARYRETPEAARQHTLELAQALAGHPLVQVQVAPHSPHGASEAMVASAVGTAAELGVPLHVHCAEGEYERQQMIRTSGLTPVAWLDRLGALTGRTVLIHAVWVDEADLELIASRGASVIHNPSSNMILGDGIAPVPAMLARGIRVGLGTDGGCTNDRHSLFDEMRTAALLQKVAAHDGKALDAATAFNMGTQLGAAALEVNAGAIEAGRAADLVSLDLGDLSLLPGPVTVRHVVYGLSPTAVDTVWVGGTPVVQEGRPLRIDPAWSSDWQQRRGWKPVASAGGDGR